jgi:hypothetical protein
MTSIDARSRLQQHPQHVSHTPQHLHGNGSTAHSHNVSTTNSSLLSTASSSNAPDNVTTTTTAATAGAHNNHHNSNVITSSSTDLTSSDVHHLSAAVMTPPAEHSSSPPMLLLPENGANSAAIAVVSNQTNGDLSALSGQQTIQSSPIAASTASMHSLVHAHLSHSRAQSSHGNNCMTSSSLSSDSPGSTGSTSPPDHSDMRTDPIATIATLPVDSALTSNLASHHSSQQHFNYGVSNQNCSGHSSIQSLPTSHYTSNDPSKCDYSSYSTDNYSRYLTGRGELLTPEVLPTYQSSHFSNSINAANFYNSQYGMLSQPYGKSPFALLFNINITHSNATQRLQVVGGFAAIG